MDYRNMNVGMSSDNKDMIKTNKETQTEKIQAMMSETMELSGKALCMAKSMKDYYLGAEPEKTEKDGIAAIGNGFLQNITEKERVIHRNILEIIDILSKM